MGHALRRMISTTAIFTDGSERAVTDDTNLAGWSSGTDLGHAYSLGLALRAGKSPSVQRSVVSSSQVPFATYAAQTGKG